MQQASLRRLGKITILSFKEKIMTLAQEIEKFQQRMSGKIPEDVQHLFMWKTVELTKTGIEKKALHSGAHIPSFSLPNPFGKVISSKNLLERSPLVISFYRGSWCPYCNIELHAIGQALPQIHEAGGQLVAISPEMPDKSLSSIEKHALKFEVLSDVGNKVAKQFGAVYVLDEELRPVYKELGFHLPDYNGDESFELPLPTTYVVNQEGRIIYSFVNADYTKRAEPEEIIDALKSIK
jgi:peroxiredoxin